MYSELIEKGYEPIKCRGKRPISKNWTKMEIIDDPAWAGNCAIRTGEVYGLDLDIYDAEIADRLVKSAMDTFGIAPLRIGMAPKTLLVYRGVLDQKKIIRSWKDSTGCVHAIELLGKGQVFMAYGEHPDTLKPYTWPNLQLPLAAELPIIDFGELTAWMNNVIVPSSWVEVGAITKFNDLGDFKGIINSGISRDQIESMLQALDNNVDNNAWVKIGMALKDWDAIAGLQLWEDWSYGGDSWKLGETAKRWSGLGFGEQVSVGSLVHVAKQAGWVAPTFRSRLLDCADEDEVNALAAEIQKSVLETKERGVLGKLFAKKLKDVIGVSVPIKEVRGMLASDVIYDDVVPDWCKNWVRVSAESAWFDIRSMTKHDSVGFNLLCSKYVDADTATNFVTKYGYVRTVNSIEYVPTSTERIIDVAGFTILNTFRYDSIPVTAANSDGVEKVLVDHLRHIMSENEVEIIIKWMAWQVQHTGKLIRWSPVIQGSQGVGKTIIGAVMTSVLGESNVGKVSTQLIKSGYNDWATGNAVNIIEELKLTGHNRHDIANELKPVITDKRLPISKKYSSGFTVNNHTNYIVFTNYKDSIPLEDGDRRWWPVFTTAPPHQEGYYRDLANVLDKGSQLRAWLMTVDTAGFGDMKEAPFSDAKNMMIATEENAHEGLSEALLLLETGGEGYHADVLLGDYFKMAIELKHGFIFSNKELHILYKKLGFAKSPKRIKYKGKLRVIWSKLPLTNVESRKRLQGNLVGH